MYSSVSYPSQMYWWSFVTSCFYCLYMKIFYLSEFPVRRWSSWPLPVGANDQSHFTRYIISEKNLLVTFFSIAVDLYKALPCQVLIKDAFYEKIAFIIQQFPEFNKVKVPIVEKDSMHSSYWWYEELQFIRRRRQYQTSSLLGLFRKHLLWCLWF